MIFGNRYNEYKSFELETNYLEGEANMGKYAIIGAEIITPDMKIEDGIVIISDEKIKALGRKEHIHIDKSIKRIDLSGMTLLPGFIDIHIHGALGVRANQGVEAIGKINEYLPSCGTTSWLPTIAEIDSMKYVVKSIERGPKGADILGIHMEGPYLAPKNIPGTPYEKAHLPDLREYEKMLKIGKGHFKLMGLAPELDGAMELIKEMHKTGVVAAIAHSKGDYNMVMEAVDAGVRHITHMYNVMTGFHHRRPGIVGAALTCDALTCELIGDGFHVSPAAMDMLVRCKGIEKVALITDNTDYAGCPDGDYGNVVKSGGIVRRKGFTEDVDGTLSGSVWPFDHNFRTVKESTRLDLRDMATMASAVPAKIIGVYDTKGSLEPDKDADITVLDADLNVKMTIVKGEVVYESQDIE